jgi:hypothetical protein
VTGNEPVIFTCNYQLYVCSINPVTIPNPVYSQSTYDNTFSVLITFSTSKGPDQILTAQLYIFLSA